MGNSLLEDAISFFTDNIEKAGQAFKESNERDRALIQSYRSGGAVDPQQRQGMLEEYIGHANPMGAVGGMIKPSTWAKYSPQAKATITEVANRSPQKFKEVLEHPQDLMVEMNPNLPGSMFSQVQGRFRAGYPVSSAIDVPSKIELLPTSGVRTDRIPEHELQHYLNSPKRIAAGAADDADAWTVARLLQSRLPVESRGSLDKVIRTATTEPPPSPESKIFGSGWDKIEAWLGGNIDARPMRTDMGPRTSTLGGMQAYDEALAHLAEAAARKNATPEIRKLARDMGVSWEDKTREVMFGGPNSPKWNPRDVAMPPRAVAPTVDIPRGTTSPGALEAFNRFKQEHGLDATFAKFRGPTTRSGSAVMEEMRKEQHIRADEAERLSAAMTEPPAGMHPKMVAKREQIIDRLAEGQTYGQALGLGKDATDEAVQKALKKMHIEQGSAVIANDDIVSQVMDAIARNLVKYPKGSFLGAGRTGMSGMRTQLGHLQPSTRLDKQLSAMPVDDFKALMQQLDRYGMLKSPIAGGSEFASSNSPLGSHLNRALEETGNVAWRPEVLRRLRRFIEETKE